MISKKVVTLLVFVFALTTSRAQFAFIPDAGFRNYLMTNGFAGCMQGDSLDTTCTAVVNATKINCSNYNIINLTGITYFDNLDTLYCYNGNSLNFIPSLPDSLKDFNCSYSALTVLPDLPSGLISLDCDVGYLTTLPLLPDSLKLLSCNNNLLTALPALPSQLEEIHCYGNNLTFLPALPSGLREIYCSSNQLIILPVLPIGLELLSCGSNNNLTLPGILPDSLKVLYCWSNSMTSLPPLPSGLYALSCDNNLLTLLPALPSALIWLSCQNNQLTSLPSLPANLEELRCYNNLLTTLPTLPSNNFKRLECQFNQLSSGLFTFELSSDEDNFYFDCSYNSGLTELQAGFPFPRFNYFNCRSCSFTSLPISLDVSGFDSEFHCDDNQISWIPGFTAYYNSCTNNNLGSIDFIWDQVKSLDCSNNSIAFIDQFPDSINYFNISNNPIACLPEIKKLGSFYWGNTNIHCLPNYGTIYNANPSLNSIHLCQPSDSCPGLWNITGQVFFDADSNCTQNGGEVNLSAVPVILDSGGTQLQRFLTDADGRYSFRTGVGSYTVRVDTTDASFRVVCPQTFFQTVSLNPADSLEDVPPFGLLCRTGFDLVAKSIAPVDMFRPGFDNVLYLNAGDEMTFSGIDCASNFSGTVKVILNSLLTYDSPHGPALTPSSVSGDTVTWNISDFSQVDPVNDFNIDVVVSTSATLNDTVCIQLIVEPSLGDVDPMNNILNACYPVRGSADPNEKYMTPSGPIDSTVQWFTFNILFQNVGNAPAENIFILDTLNVNLDASTFTFLSSSHEAITQMLPGNVLRFNFHNIHLLDSVNNEPESHGYVQFKIKKVENLPLNTVISNRAFIYFDYNAAVPTNTVSATLNTCLPVTVAFNAVDSSCTGWCITFWNQSLNATSYQWSFPGGVPNTSTSLNPYVCYPEGGVYPVTLIAGCAGQNHTLTIDSAVTIYPEATFTVSDDQICAGSCVDLNATNANTTQWHWYFTGAMTVTSNLQNPTNICYANEGSYNLAFAVFENGCSDSLFVYNYLKVFPEPVVSIQQFNDSLFATGGFVSYQWFLDTIPVNGATDSIYVAQQNGIYSVVAADSNGCEATATAGVMVVVYGEADLGGIDIYPNPVVNHFTVVSRQYAINSIEILSTVGQTIMTYNFTNAVQSITIDISGMQPGVYFLSVKTDSGTIIMRFIKYM